MWQWLISRQCQHEWRWDEEPRTQSWHALDGELVEMEVRERIKCILCGKRAFRGSGIG